ncbi:MAG: sulfurtransferase [Rhodospirillales bacterium]|nr:sulfurtransferase [Rhodospirillales bacterium]
MRRLPAIAAFLIFALQAAAAATAATPLVDVAWLEANAGAPGLVVLDIRNALGKGSKEAYLQGHIPGAVYSDYLKDGWRTKVGGVPGQLPPPGDLEKLIGGLGIANDSHVVIVAGGVSALDMGAATRVYWTFKVLGHDAVSILDGGHKAYAADPANPLETGWRDPWPADFEAGFRPELIADRATVEAAMANGTALIDMRPPEQYRGEKTHTAAKRKGTIPGAVNVPEAELTTAEGGFVGAGRVAELLAAAGVAAEDEAIAFCNTGHWASLGWFAKSEILGRKNVRLYDGSMVEWSAVESLPVEVGAGQ